MVERVETRSDGFVRTDSFLLRVGGPPPPPIPMESEGGCGCVIAAGSDRAPFIGVLFVLLAFARRRRGVEAGRP